MESKFFFMRYIFLFTVGFALFYGCGKNGLSRKEAEKSVRAAFELFMVVQSMGGQHLSDRDVVKIHDLRGPDEGPVDATVLGIGSDSAKVMHAEAKEKGHYVAVATLVRIWPTDGAAYDTLGGVFAIFKSGDRWEALPLSGVHRLNPR